MNYDGGKIEFTSGVDTSGLERDIRRAQNSFSDLNNNVRKECSGIDGSIKAIGTSIATVFTVQKAGEFIKKMVSVRGEIESLEKSFSILAGTVQGKNLFEEIREFATKTPMTMPALAKGAQTLLAFNYEAKNVMPIIRAIGDISMGNEDKFNSLTLAFAQMSSTGKLMGQDLLQMINAGFNPLAVISEQTGKSIGVLKEEMAAGAISADMITKAFMDATSAGGKFNGMLEQQSKGIEGSISNLEGAIQDMFNELGEKSQDVITGSIQSITSLVQNYEKVGRVIVELIATYGAYKATVITLSTIENLRYQATLAQMAGMTKMQAITDILRTKTEALNIAMAKNPYMLVAAGVAALGFGMYKLITHQTDAEKAQKKLNEAFNESEKNIISEKVQIDNLFGKLKAAKEGTEEYESAKKAIITQYGEYLNGLSSEIQSLQDVEGAYKAVTSAIEESARARAFESYTKDMADEYADKMANVRDEVKKMLEDKFGTEKGDEYFWKIVPVLEGKEKATDEINDIISQFDKTKLRMTGSGLNASYVEITTNDLKSQMTEAAKARKVMNDAFDSAKIKFQNPQPADSGKDGGSGGGNEVKEIIRNKKYWEDYLKEQQGLLDAMTEAQLKTEDAEKIRANIIEAQKHIDDYNVSKTVSSDKEDNKTAIQTADRLEKIANYKDTVSREVRQAEFDIRQAEIDAMQEGVDKEIKQNELNYDRMIEANLRRQEDMVEALRDAKELEWENENPKAKEQGKTFDRSSVTVSDLSPEQLNILKEYERIAVEMRQKSNKDCIEKMLSDIMTYEQKRTEIAEEYEQKRKALYVDGDANKGLKNGVTQGNVDELDLQEKNALTAIDEEFAQREVTYQAWCESIADMSLQQLEQVLAQAEEELKQLEQSGTADSKQLSVARAKVSTAKTKVEKANAKSKTSPDKRSIKEWNELREALEDCCGTFNELGDAVGGVAGDILSTTGSIMTSTLSVVNGIVQLVTMSATGMQGTATAAATAIATVEKASVILAVISAAIQIAMQIIKLFNTDKKNQEQIEKLQVQIDKLKKGYEELDRAINKAFSSDASKLIEQQNELLKQQKILIQQQINEERTKKKPDDDVIKEWEEQIDEIDLQISDNKDKAIDAIFGDDLKSAIENFAEAYVEAWEDGSNKAQSAKDVVKKMMQQMVAESIKAAIQSSGKMEQIRQKLQEFYADGILSGWEQDYIYNMAEELQKELDDQFGWADDLMSGNSDGQDSTKQGFATMSQDSADELNGRFTAIQIDTSNIKSLCDSILINTQFIVNAVVAMRQNSDEIKNLALVALDYLEAISRNTYELYEMNERLGKIEQNTRNL